MEHDGEQVVEAGEEEDCTVSFLIVFLGVAVWVLGVARGCDGEDDPAGVLLAGSDLAWGNGGGPGSCANGGW